MQYSLQSRDPIAVPYLAKGVASPTAEWGHPDVAIILTCLSFYYEGLSLLRFKQAFEHLLKLDEPTFEYERWTCVGVPQGLRDHLSINPGNGFQLRELHGYVKYNSAVLDFYLDNFVFPKHAKQYRTKLQASGWDLVTGTCQTTGFSGTNDSRHQLPMIIQQNDLPDLTHTNPEVLAYLLAGRNRYYVQMADDDTGRRWNEEGLLKNLLKNSGAARQPYYQKHGV